jgi:hypothetical protein
MAALDIASRIAGSGRIQIIHRLARAFAVLLFLPSLIHFTCITMEDQSHNRLVAGANGIERDDRSDSTVQNQHPRGAHLADTAIPAMIEFLACERASLYETLRSEQAESQDLRRRLQQVGALRDEITETALLQHGLIRSLQLNSHGNELLVESLREQIDVLLDQRRLTSEQLERRDTLLEAMGQQIQEFVVLVDSMRQHVDLYKHFMCTPCPSTRWFSTAAAVLSLWLVCGCLDRHLKSFVVLSLC